MYRVLFATNEPAVLEPLNQITNWQSMSFHDPMLAGDADEAIRLMESKRVDAIAYMLDADEARKLSLYLNNMRPSLPIFQIQRTLDAQKEEIINLRRLLDRLHADMSDEVYDEAAVLDILRDEVTHNLLAGDVAADAQLRGTLQMLRSFVSPDKQAILFDFDLPQGEVYLSAQWHYGSERLENALRNNFFGRYYDDIYYCVAVLTPRHIRVAACQRYDTESISENDLLQKANSHVEQVLDNIKEYLGLDMVTTECHILDKLCLLTQEHQQSAEG